MDVNPGIPLFSRILSIGILSDIVLWHASPASLFYFSQTCKLARRIVTLYMKNAWNINRVLQKFFTDPLTFRSLQARTSTLISGSTALQFFDRTTYPDSDLDLYVYKEWTEEICRWLIRVGYVYTPKFDQDEDVLVAANVKISTVRLYKMRGVYNILDFFKPRMGKPDLKIQVITAERTPMQIILHFHSTCVLNVITFEKAYSLYPRATFEERYALMCASAGPAQEKALEKYADRGWTMISQVSTIEEASTRSPFSTTDRWIDDKFSWTIPLSMSGVVFPHLPALGSPPLLQDPTSMTNWVLRFDDNGKVFVEFDILRRTLLKYQYAIRQGHFYSSWVRRVDQLIRGSGEWLYDRDPADPAAAPTVYK
ncbi:hypothetical protein JAAARDRAFT_139328 [Jaapia argillacea MUCL 33604]|uniref:F-box domain-containing protein n=1 Tax=Jaapia argillacea MUCL 33604 TaxID=933084 RepID=A0A067PBN1_9AGAM|nr:hypothetical protein JAAARDRAFT_139328 [Jaapia argillacea MUCL 33604]